MNLNSLIIELLYTHDCVVIPGVGGFLLNYVPATIHPVQHLFVPPSRTVAFNSALQANDGVMANAWALKSGMGYQQAMECVRGFAVDLNLKLQTTGSYRFEGIGRLIDHGDGLVHFEPEKSVNLLADAFGLPSFTSPAINRGDYHHVSQTVRVDRKPSRKPGRLPVAVRWVLMLLPVMAVGAWFMFDPVASPSHIEKANLGFETISPGATNPVEKSSLFTDRALKSDSAVHMADAVANEPPVDSVLLNPVQETVTAIVGKEPVEAPQPVAQSAKTTTTGGFHIIAGCFSTESNAINYAAALRERGYDSSLEGTTRSGLFRVSVGYYSSYNEAVAALGTIRSDVNSEAWLMKN